MVKARDEWRAIHIYIAEIFRARVSGEIRQRGGKDGIMEGRRGSTMKGCRVLVDSSVSLPTRTVLIPKNLELLIAIFLCICEMKNCESENNSCSNSFLIPILGDLLPSNLNQGSSEFGICTALLPTLYHTTDAVMSLTPFALGLGSFGQPILLKYLLNSSLLSWDLYLVLNRVLYICG